jgi:hypothetical protein
MLMFRESLPCYAYPHTLRISHTTSTMITMVPTIPYPNIENLLAAWASAIGAVAHYTSTWMARLMPNYHPRGRS